MTEAPDIRPSIFAEESPVGRVLDRSPASGQASGSRADAQIDAFIRHRHQKRVQEERGRLEEEAWVESARRYNAARRAENALAWAEWHRGQIERLRAATEVLCGRHEDEIRKLEEKGRDAA